MTDTHNDHPSDKVLRIVSPDEAAPESSETLPTDPAPPRVQPPPVTSLSAQQDADLDEQIFRLQLKLDIEVERALMYRVLIVGEAVVLLALGREWWTILAQLG